MGSTTSSFVLFTLSCGFLLLGVVFVTFVTTNSLRHSSRRHTTLLGEEYDVVLMDDELATDYSQQQYGDTVTEMCVGIDEYETVYSVGECAETIANFTNNNEVPWFTNRDYLNFTASDIMLCSESARRTCESEEQRFVPGWGTHFGNFEINSTAISFLASIEVLYSCCVLSLGQEEAVADLSVRWDGTCSRHMNLLLSKRNFPYVSLMLAHCSTFIGG